MPAHHWALGLEYDGRGYHGWQRQADVPTLQACVETALSRIAAQPVHVAASGRTDTGVHASGQVVSFASAAMRTADAWLRGTNSVIDGGIAVQWAHRVPADFHARFSAIARRYQYLIFEADVPPTHLERLVTWSRVRLDDEAMHRSAQLLVGEHDFTSFRAASCQAQSAHRLVHEIAVRRFAAFVVIDVTANAFLHHMVRNIASALMSVGRAEQSVGWVRDLLMARSRPLTGPTAPPDGLYLVDVRYPPALALPAGKAPAVLRAVAEFW